MRLHHSLPALAALCVLVTADPTWPARTDELEEIMYQISQFRTRNFADTILPCTNEASGPGRQNAAEWLRVGFHDMSTADVATGTGGLDASIQYELDTGENLGPAFNTTLKFMSAFLTERSSMADLIALGVVAAVRSCGGPVVEYRAGRIDATEAGRLGVPQPEHHVHMFQSQFRKMGFSNAEMIEVTACGHTIGGVHRSEFPELVPGEIGNGEAPLDGSVAAFDNAVLREYLAGNSTSPLIVGPAIKLGKDSDARIYASDGNETVKKLADPKVFEERCVKVLQKMIEVVPAGTTLSEPLRPYMVKPVGMRLTIERGGREIRLTGNVRVRTTELQLELLKNLTLVWKDRTGMACELCSTTATPLGRSYGMDDSFEFFPFDTTLPATDGISSFVLALSLKNGTVLHFDNNGHEYPIQDAAILQYPQSCLTQHDGKTSITAAIRNDRLEHNTTLRITYRVPRIGLAVPTLHNITLPMVRGGCVGPYTLFSMQWTIPGGHSHAARFDVISGSGSTRLGDEFHLGSDLPGTCDPFLESSMVKCQSEVAASPAKAITATLGVSTSAASTATPTSTPRVFGTVPPSASTTPNTVAFATGTPSSTVIAAEPATPPHMLSPNVVDVAYTWGQLFVSYVTNLFGYDRYQLVNNELSD